MDNDTLLGEGVPNTSPMRRRRHSLLFSPLSLLFFPFSFLCSFALGLLISQCGAFPAYPVRCSTLEHLEWFLASPVSTIQPRAQALFSSVRRAPATRALVFE